MTTAPDSPHPVLFFDGDCNLCNSTVDFVIRRDRARRFRYAPLASDAADRLLPDDLPEKHNRESFILLEGDRLWVRSDAALRVAKGLPLPWKLGSVFLIVPRFLRDPVYRLISKHRYRMFGKSDTCRVPTAEEQGLFLE